jgi:hypothetical protein
MRPQENLVFYKQSILSVADAQEGNKIGDLDTALVKKKNQIFHNPVMPGLHCKEDPIYVFPEMKLFPNFHIHVL